MPKATNLIEAYNNFVVEPLKTEEEFNDFYVARPKNASSPIEELKDRIENADSAKKYEDEDGRWCDINPLLMPLVEKWKKA